jgi:hypothetical protein
MHITRKRSIERDAQFDHVSVDDTFPLATGIVTYGTQAVVAMHSLLQYWHRSGCASDFGPLGFIDLSPTASAPRSLQLPEAEPFLLNRGADLLLILLDTDKLLDHATDAAIKRAISCSSLVIVITFGDTPVESDNAQTKVMPWTDWRTLHLHWPRPSIDNQPLTEPDTSSLSLFELLSGLVIASMTLGIPCVDFEDVCTALQGEGELKFQHWVATDDEPVEIFLSRIAAICQEESSFDAMILLLQARDPRHYRVENVCCAEYFEPLIAENGWLLFSMPVHYLGQDGRFAVSVYTVRSRKQTLLNCPHRAAIGHGSRMQHCRNTNCLLSASARNVWSWKCRRGTDERCRRR